MRHSRKARIVFAVTAAVMLSIFSRIENWKRDLTTNFAKLDPQSSDPLLRPLTMDGSAECAADTIQRWVRTQPRWSIESQNKSGGAITMHLTHQTRLLRFTDDIRVFLVPEGDATRVNAESQSRFGKGDLGQNPRNLRALVSGLSEHR